MSNDAPTRDGAHRELALDHHGRYCQDCLWTPANEVQEHKLHVHFVAPQSGGGLDPEEDTTVLCRDCHLSKHSESEFSHELVGRLTRTLADAITHKQDGFVERTARRVRLGSVVLLDGRPPVSLSNSTQTDEYALVEGLIDGDHYDAYYVDADQPYLAMCSCYQHSFGAVRAKNICTHVGAAIVRKGIGILQREDDEAAFEYVRETGERLNERAADYIAKRNLVKEELDTLDIADRFSESWADRARRQAMKMTRYGREYKAYGGECEGCEVVLTADGYRCSNAKNGSKFPCPAKLGAYILDNAERFQPDIDEGQMFEAVRAFAGVEKDIHLVVTDVDDDEQTITFRRVVYDQTKVTLGFEAVVDALLGNDLRTARESDLSTYYTGIVTDADGTPLFVAPTCERGETLSVAAPDVHPDLDRGDIIHVVEADHEARELLVERVTGDDSLGGDQLTIPYETAVPALRGRRLEKGRVSDVADIIATNVIEEGDDQMVAFYSPYEAKETFMGLDKDETNRHWEPDLGKWVAKADMLDDVVAHLAEEWGVFVPADIRDELEQSG